MPTSGYSLVMCFTTSRKRLPSDAQAAAVRQDGAVEAPESAKVALQASCEIGVLGERSRVVQQGHRRRPKGLGDASILTTAPYPPAPQAGQQDLRGAMERGHETVEVKAYVRVANKMLWWPAYARDRRHAVPGVEVTGAVCRTYRSSKSLTL